MTEHIADDYKKCHKGNTGKCKDCDKCDGNGWVDMTIEYYEDDIDIQVSHDE